MKPTNGIFLEISKKNKNRIENTAIVGAGTGTGWGLAYTFDKYRNRTTSTPPPIKSETETKSDVVSKFTKPSREIASNLRDKKTGGKNYSALLHSQQSESNTPSTISSETIRNLRKKLRLGRLSHDERKDILSRIRSISKKNGDSTFKTFGIEQNQNMIRLLKSRKELEKLRGNIEDSYQRSEPIEVMKSWYSKGQ